jgi:hypothetical protein
LSITYVAHDTLSAQTAADQDYRDDSVHVVRASLERWLVAGGARGGPLSAQNAWALIGLASGDQAFSERCLGLLERPEEVSRARTRLSRGESLVELAPRPPTAGTSCALGRTLPGNSTSTSASKRSIRFRSS